MVNRDVLSERYATPEINYIFSPEGTILGEREFGIVEIEAQKRL